MVKETTKNRFQFWLGILFSVACLIAIFILIDPREIMRALREADYRYLVLSTGGIVLFLYLRAIRWRFMLDNAVPYGRVFHIQNIGYLLTYVLPFRLGDVGRAVLIGNVPPVTVAQGISTMVVERVLDLLFIVILLPFTLANVDVLAPVIRDAARVATFLAAMAIVVLILAANFQDRALQLFRLIVVKIRFLDGERWARYFQQLLSGLNSLTKLRDGLYLVFLSVLIWIPIIFAYYSGMIAVGLEPTMAMAGFVVCAAALSITTPSSPGQVGVFHAGVIFALAQILRQPEGPSASFAFLYHALNFAVVIVWGLLGIYRIETTIGNVVRTSRALLQRNSGSASP